MELNSYQKQVMRDLGAYLACVDRTPNQIGRAHV